MAAIVTYYAFNPNVDTTKEPAVETSDISTTQSTGGVQDTTSETSAASSKKTSTTQATKTASTPSHTTDLSAAPKQAEIAATVTKKYEYHALQTPNDPMYSTFVDSVGTTHTP